jgi:UPF0716 protein FxsA
MILLAVAALLVAEVAALVAVTHQVGLLLTLALLVAGTLVGGWLLRREGTRAWRAFAVAVAEGRPPGREVLDGMLVLLGGGLVLFPGFVSDALGLLCLLPPTRRVLAGLLRRYAARRVQGRVVRVRARRGPAARYDPTARYDPPAPHDPTAPHDAARPPAPRRGPVEPPRLGGSGAGGAEPPGRGRVIDGEVGEP